MRKYKYKLLYWQGEEIKFLNTNSLIKLNIFKLCTDWSSYEVNRSRHVKLANKYMNNKEEVK